MSTKMVAPPDLDTFTVYVDGSTKAEEFQAACCRSVGSDYVFFGADGREIRRFPTASVVSISSS
jgi:hypothetical protein